MFVTAFSRSIIPKWAALGSVHNLIGWLAFPLHGYCRIGYIYSLSEGSRLKNMCAPVIVEPCKAHFTAGEPQPQRTVYEFERT